MEAQLMSHDSAMTAGELFTHLHMLRRRTVLDTAGVDLPQRDKDKLMVMSIGDNDLFGPDAHMVAEWKKDPALESVMLTDTAVNEQGKASRKLSRLMSSSSRRPRSMAHQSSLDAIPAPKSQESLSSSLWFLSV